MEKSKAGRCSICCFTCLIAIMAIWSVALNESFTKVSNAAFTIFDNRVFGWLYLLAMMIIFSICYLHGLLESMERFVLEGMTLKPEYSNLTWFGLLFGCGMGVGLVILGCCRAVDTLLKSGGRRKRHTGSSRLRNEIPFLCIGGSFHGQTMR